MWIKPVLNLFILISFIRAQTGDPLFTERRPIECDTGSCFQVKMNPTIVKSVCLHTSEHTSTFEFNEKLFSYIRKVLPRSNLFETEDGTQAIFTCSNGNSLYGSISMENALGKFETLYIEKRNNNDQIAVFLADSDIPEDKGVRDTLNDNSTRFAKDPELLRKGASDNTTLARYSIKFYYTPQFAAVTSDISTFIDQALAVVNQGYNNSGVLLEAHSLCNELATIQDQDSPSNMIAAFRDMKGSVSKLRGGADIAALLVKDFDICGIGYHDTVVNAGATVSVTKKSCILWYYSLGHEIGHNIGLAHNPANSTNTIYPYGHGHLIQAGASSTGYRTILAYSSNGHSDRVNYYSNPAVIYPRTKTPTGVKGISNNAALLMRNRFALQSLGDGNECDVPTGYRVSGIPTRQVTATLGSTIWIDRPQYSITDMPQEIIGSTLFQPATPYVDISTIKVFSPHEAIIYVGLYESRDGGLMEVLPEQGWTLRDGWFVEWNRGAGERLHKIWSKPVDAGETISFTTSENRMTFAIFISEG